MKSNFKLFSAILTMLFFCSCGTVQLTDTQEVVGSILARRVGHILALDYPKTVERLKPVAMAFVESGNVLSIDTFVSILAGDIDDLLLRADIQELSALIRIESPCTPEQMKMAKRIMRAFLQGVEIGRQEVESDYSVS